MKNKYLVIGFMLLLSIGNVSGITDDIYDYGIYTATTSHLDFRVHGLNCDFTGYGTFNTIEYDGHTYDYVRPYTSCTGQTTVWGSYTYWSCYGCVQHPSISANFVGVGDYDLITFACLKSDSSKMTYTHQKHTGHFYDPTDDIYTISGDTCGVNNVTFYIYDGSNYQYFDYDTLDSSGDSYSFSVVNNTPYKIKFDDGHEYEFTVTDNIVYNYDICAFVTINFYDKCHTSVNNLGIFFWSTTAPTPEFAMIDGYTWQGFAFGENVNIGDDIQFIISWYDGTQYYTYPVTESPQIINITNVPIDYVMGVKTITEAGIALSDVQVSISQDCSYGGTKNKVTFNGWVYYDECSNTGGSLTVSKLGYKSATMPFPTLMATAQTYLTSYIITLVASDSGNDTSGDFNDTIINISEVVTPDEEYDLDGNNSDLHDGVEIWFINEGGHRTTKISDTDTYVDLWFVNKNSNESSMTLEFQQSYTSSYYWENLNWTIAYKKFGFKRIYNTNFTPYYYYYRAKIYNDELLQWDRIRYLEVANKTKEEEKHYENLSTCLWFRHTTVDHKIDYRNDIEIVCNAASNNTTLLDLDIELYNGSVLVDYINLTWADFSGAAIKWFYIWEPDYNYASGYNYTTKMIGFDGYVLRIDHVDCFTEDRQNKLTINVKNQYGTDLDNCFVFLEGWGSLPTGNLNYNAYEGLDNGYYRFKATKPDYVGTGWSDITLSDSDEIVTYVLTSTDSEAGNGMEQQKISDSDLSNIYLILMAIILIFIIFGGFIYATK